MNTKEMLKPTKTNKQECNQQVTTQREKLEQPVFKKSAGRLLHAK